MDNIAGKKGKESSENSPEWYDVATAATLTGKTPRTVRRWLNENKVEGRKNDAGHWEVKAESLPTATGGVKSEPPNATVAELTDRVAALSMQVGRFQERAEQARKMLPPGAKKEIERLKREKQELEARLKEKESGIEKLKRTPFIRWFIPGELKKDS